MTICPIADGKFTGHIKSIPDRKMGIPQILVVVAWLDVFLNWNLSDECGKNINVLVYILEDGRIKVT